MQHERKIIGFIHILIKLAFVPNLFNLGLTVSLDWKRNSPKLDSKIVKIFPKLCAI
jgi:hypothetical protein